MTERGLSELAVAIANWCVSIGAVDANKLPGLWEGETAPMEPFGPLTVRANAHPHEVDGIPPYTFVAEPKGNPLGFVAVVNPYGGSLMAGGWNQHDLEDKLIAHFTSLAAAPAVS